MDFEEWRRQNDKTDSFEPHFDPKAIEGKIKAEIEKREPSIQWKKEIKKSEKLRLELNEWEKRRLELEEIKDRRMKFTKSKGTDELAVTKDRADWSELLKSREAKESSIPEYRTDRLDTFEQSAKVESEVVRRLNLNDFLREIEVCEELTVTIGKSKQDGIGGSFSPITQKIGANFSRGESDTLTIKAKGLKMRSGIPHSEELTFESKKKKRGGIFKFLFF